jgi:hypothetical protein
MAFPDPVLDFQALDKAHGRSASKVYHACQPSLGAKNWCSVTTRCDDADRETRKISTISACGWLIRFWGDGENIWGG